MKRLAAAFAFACMLATLVACAKRTVAGRWHLDREHTTMPMGFNLKGQSYLEIKLNENDVELRDFVSAPEMDPTTLMDRHYPLDGTEREADSNGDRTLYISARLDGPTLYTQERIVDRSSNAKSPEVKTSVTYVVSSNGMHLVGTDENGKIATYDRE